MSLPANPLARRAFSVLVIAYGLLTVAGTLGAQLTLHFSRHTVQMRGFIFGVPLIVGTTLLYVGMLLGRGKRTAWAFALLVFSGMVAFGTFQLVALSDDYFLGWQAVARTFIVPALLAVGLWIFQASFTVRSDLRSFAVAARFSALVLLVAFVYGVVGFLVLDERDFHQEISLPEAMHRTVDQFDLTTDHSLEPHTRRARLFASSLTIVSIGAVAYALVALFQPIKARLFNTQAERALAQRLLEERSASSEDFFKLWPHDKRYFFTATHTAGLAYAVHRGVALVVGDPFGRPSQFAALMTSFDAFCRLNDWAIAFVHTEPSCNDLYKTHDFSLQKIGEEAIIDLQHFLSVTSREKYFRHIASKFTKAGCTVEALPPPHSQTVLQALQAVSDEWLQQPGRQERTFLLGAFSANYMQQCTVLVLRGSTGTIQAFINQLPTFTPTEANFDLLRHSSTALGNANDFLLLEFCKYLHRHGYKRLNLGLCPLAGLQGNNEQQTVLNSALRFLYANGDRFYSFSGLRRFKAKYQPEWQTRYIAYRGGIRGFTKAVTALGKALKP